jgi:hypothetical protein
MDEVQQEKLAYEGGAAKEALWLENQSEKLQNE